MVSLSRAWGRWFDAKLALERLDLPSLLESVREVQAMVGDDADEIRLLVLFAALRIKLFVATEMNSCRLPPEEVLDELDEAVRAQAENGARLLPVEFEHWVLGQRALLRNDYRLAYVALMPIFMIETVRERAARLVGRPWTWVEQQWAKFLVDSAADLVRVLREVRPPQGTVAASRVQIAQLRIIEIVRDLAAHEEMSRWSARRLYMWLGFEAADRGERSRALEMLSCADASLSQPYARNTLLATLDGDFIKALLEVLQDDGDLERAAALFQTGLERLTALGFERRRRERWTLERVLRNAGSSRTRRVEPREPRGPADQGTFGESV